MDLGLNGETALVTAASYGLGYACAKELAAEGVRVVICSRDGDRANKAAEQITQPCGATGYRVGVHEPPAQSEGALR